VNLNRRLLLVLAVLGGALLYVAWPPQTQAFVEIPYTLGKVVNDSTHIVVMRVEKVDKEKNMIIYKKVEDLKGKHPTDVIRHNIAKAKLKSDREWQATMQWAEIGKTAVFFHNGGASETCIGTYWYQAYPGGEWWNQSHGEPYLGASFHGNIDKLVAAVKEIQAGRETVVPCMVYDKPTMEKGTGKIQRLKASLKLQDYNPKRDFVGWGGEDFRRLLGMPGFTHYSALTRVDPEAQAISAVDFDGDGKADLCLVGASKVALLQNGGEAFTEVSLPGAAGCRAAVWADYNSDGLPDLLLATPTGPKLYTNLGKAQFRDDSHLLPREAGYNLTAAAWLDHDGDGKPDLLLGNGFHGLRLYRNKGAAGDAKEPMKLGKWHHIGPFDNGNNQGFATAYPPEKEIDLAKKYEGKNKEEAAWKAADFTDGAVNNLAIFKPENNIGAAVYLFREIECARAMDLPVSLGSDDTLTIWLNEAKVFELNIQRACAADQNQVTLKLKEGKNKLLMKVCNGGGPWEFYFQAKDNTPPRITWTFEDVSTQVGFGPDGLGSTVKGDNLTVCDVNGDGRPDILYGAGAGLLLLNNGKAFTEARDCGINCKFGKVGPVFADFDSTGFPSLLVPQLDGKCKLYKNDGKGRFTDVAAQAGDLGKNRGACTSAAWGDIDNDGHLDLLIGCLRGPNRVLRNKGDGTFEDITEALGLHQKIYNTQGVCLADLNKDGRLDMVFNNEGQDSCILLGDSALPRKNTPVTLAVKGTSGVIGSRLRVLDKDGKTVAVQSISGGDGRGGQHGPHARFALPPGNYKVEVRYTSGKTMTQDLTVAAAPMHAAIEEK